VDKLEAAVEKAKQGLRAQEKKLKMIIKTFGEQLEYFQSTMDEAEALTRFESELKEGLNLHDDSEEQDEDMKDLTKKGEEGEDIEMLNSQSESDHNTGEENTDEEKQPICSSCGAKQAEKKKFCGDCGAKQEENSLRKIPKKKRDAVVTDAKKSSDGKISDIPVWIVISLKKPLEKFYATDTNTEICNRDDLEKAELILLKFHPKHRSRIVLKSVTYEGAEEHLKLLNEVFEGPWKSLRVSKEEFQKEKTSYSLEQTLRYLAKRYTRQKVTDNTIETCELCDKEFKHAVMDTHRTKLCSMRKEPCQYCEVVIVVSSIKEHEESCPKFPVTCPQKCSRGNLQRCQVEDHLKICENSKIECEFKHVGCNTEHKRKDSALHLKVKALEHVQLLNARVALMSTYFTSKHPELEKLLHSALPPKEKEGKDIDENKIEEDLAIKGTADNQNTLSA